MILDVKEILARFAPDLGVRDPSCVVLRASRSNLLVFDGDDAQPKCVVQRGDTENLVRVRELQERLHPRIPDVVGAVYGGGPWGAGEYLLVVSGMAGRPWFRLHDVVRTPEQWVQLRRRSLEALESFHAAVRAEPKWSGVCTPAAELRGLVQRMSSAGVELHDGVAAEALRSAEGLESLGTVHAFFHHGDFCLNNLLIAEHSVGIVDFEEFGLTMMPLLDEIGLALSLAERGHGRGGEAVPDAVRACLDGSEYHGIVQLHHLRGLFLFTMLWHIEQASKRPRRAPRRRRLEEQLLEFLDAPERFLPQ